MKYPEGTYCRFFGAYGKVYSLTDSKGKIFYVGCTVHPMKHRLRNHLSEAKSNCGITNKVKNKIIADSNFEIVATILEILYVTGRTPYEARRALTEVELEWVQKMLDEGHQLCNREAKSLMPKNIKEQVGQTFQISKG